MRPALALSGLVAALALSWAACGEGERDVAPRRVDGAQEEEVPRLSGRGDAVTETKRAESVPVPSPSDSRPRHEVLVLDDQGAPVVGALVTHWRETQHTDDAGSVRVGPFVGGHGTPTQCRRERTISVQAEGYAPVSHVCRNDGGPVDTLRLRRRGLPLAGHCVDSEGQPVPGLELRIDYEEGAATTLATDEHGRFTTASTAPNEGTLRADTRGWTCRPVTVVPPEEGVELVVYRTAWVRGTFEVTYEGWHHSNLYVSTNQGWTGRLDPTHSFSIPCCPGTVELTWRGEVIARCVVEEGADQEGHVIRLDTTAAQPEATDEQPPAHFDLDLSLVDGRETLLVAYFDDLGLRNLGFWSGKEVQRVPLPSAAVRWLGVRRNSGAWRRPLEAGQLVRLEHPPAAELRLRLVGPGGQPVTQGWVGLHWSGTRGHAAAAFGVSDGTRPPGTALCQHVGPGAYDLVWQADSDRPPVLLQRDVVMPDPPQPLDLGTLTVPEPRTLHVLVTDVEGARVPGAVVRLLGRHWGTAVRAGRDGEALVPVSDPVDLRLQAEAPDGRRGEASVSPDALEHVVTIRVGL